MTTIDDIAGRMREYRPVRAADRGLKRASVLVPLFPRNGELHLLFMKRSDTVEHHKGQISFPGGVMEETDESSSATALRETEEEIGIPHSAVRIIGELDDLIIPTGFHVTPVVGYVPKLPGLSVHVREVDEVFDAPLSFFLDAANERIEQRLRDGIPRTVFVFTYRQYEIWGATAAIIKSFASIVGPLKNSL